MNESTSAPDSTDPHSASDRRRVTVVGGGIAGLAAAWELSADPDVDVTVVEAADRLGGRIATSAIDLPDGSTLTIDEGADAFLARVPDAIELCDELGLSDELTQPSARSALVLVDGELRRLPDGTVLGVPVDLDAVAASGVLSEAGLARAAQERDRVGPAPDGDVPIGPFLRDRFGDEVVDRLVAPLIGGINAGDIETMSLAAVTPQLAAAAADGDSLSLALARRLPPPDPQAPVFRTPRGGMQQLVDVLADALVERGVRLQTGHDLRDLATLQADGVVLATPARVAAPLLAPLSPRAAAAAASIRHSSVVLVTFVFAADALDVPAGTSGVLVPRAAGRLMTAASFGSSKWDHWDDARHVVLRVSAGRDGDERAAAMSDDDVAGALLDDLRHTVGLDGAPLATRISRYPDGFAQYDVGHLDTVAALRDALESDDPTVRVAGSGYDGVGIPASIRSGRTAARKLLERAQPPVEGDSSRM